MIKLGAPRGAGDVIRLLRAIGAERRCGEKRARCCLVIAVANFNGS